MANQSNTHLAKSFKLKKIKTAAWYNCFGQEIVNFLKCVKFFCTVLARSKNIIVKKGFAQFKTTKWSKKYCLMSKSWKSTFARALCIKSAAKLMLQLRTCIIKKKWLFSHRVKIIV